MRFSIHFTSFCFFFLVFTPAIVASDQGGIKGLVKVKNGRFEMDKRPYKFIGVNYWPAAHLGMKSGPGDQARLLKELDFLRAQGVRNIRVLVSSEGDSSFPLRVSPSYQPQKGRYNEEVLKGLDFLLVESGKRNLKLVLFFTNNWEWSGGFGQYLEWNGVGKTPLPKSEGWTWDGYRDYISKFYTCKDCIQQVNSLISKVVTRVNSISGKPYKSDPAIFSWELANEPRPMRPAANEAYQKWVQETSLLIKKLDQNHMVATGIEGDVAYDFDMSEYKKAHRNSTVDYLTLHIWPKNWKWFPDTSISANMYKVLEKSGAMLNRHLKVAEELKKPLVLEEFGLPRDGHLYTAESTTTSRDQYYNWAMDIWKKNEHPQFGGLAFWTFGGFTAFPKDGSLWKSGEPFRGDPGVEEQGLNSIYEGDRSTWDLIRTYTKP